MPINYPQFRALSPSEMGGLGSINFADALRSGLQNANLLQETRYKPQQLQQDLYNKQLANKINEAKAKYAEQQEAMGLKEKEAQINHLAAQTALSQGNLGLIPYYKQLYTAQAQAQEANAAKARVLGNLYSQVVGGGWGEQRTQPQPGQAPGQITEQPQPVIGQSTPSYSNKLTQSINERQQQTIPGQATDQQLTNMNRANLAAGLLHLPVSSQVVNGQLVTNNPLSGITSTKVGPSAEETAFATGMGKGKAAEYNNAVTTYNGLQNQGVALSELADAVENNPEFRNITGKINQPLTNWFGTPEQKELLGRLQSSSGEIALQIAPSLKGAWTGRDQTMVNGIKASPNDFPDVFIGKLKAQMLINNVMQERARLKAEYLEQGKSTLEASRLAVEQTPLEKYKPQIEAMIKHKEPLTAEQLQLAKLELARRGVQ